MSQSFGTRTVATLLALALIAALALVAAAGGAMRSEKLGPALCETTGGGRFVEIPEFPGERIDRRLLTDIRRLERRYRILITDGYSLDAVHAANGEHPIGLAIDVVPDRAAGGRWSDIDRLARWAEPRPDHPRAPFRWVGYDGDAGHGRGNHLHLSWSHTMTKPGRPARTVYTMRCPTAPIAPLPIEPESDPTAGGTGIDPTIPLPSGTPPVRHSGGIDAMPHAHTLAPPVPESGGVSLRH